MFCFKPVATLLSLSSLFLVGAAAAAAGDTANVPSNGLPAGGSSSVALLRYQVGKFGPTFYAPSVFGTMVPVFDRVIGYDELHHPVWEKEERLCRIFARRRAALLRAWQADIQAGRVRTLTGLKSELERWQDEARKVHRHTQLYGPVTTKTFLRPGLTPQESQVWLQRQTGVRLDAHGKWQPVVRR